MPHGTVQPEITPPSLLYPAIEGLLFLLLLTALGMCLYLMKKFVRGSFVLPFTYFAAGTLILGIMRVYVLFARPFEIWWHIIFYLAIIAFIIGVAKLNQLATRPVSAGFSTNDKFIVVALVIVSLLILFFGHTLEASLGAILTNSLIYKLGLHHIFSFVLAFIAAFYTYQIQGSWSKFMNTSIFPFLGFLSLLTAQHFWALLNHTLRIFHFAATTIIFVEQLIVIAALVSLNISFLKIAVEVKQ